MDPASGPPNPYASQQSNPYASTPGVPYAPTDPSQPHFSSIIQQMLPFGILMMVNGGLFALFGVMAISIPLVAFSFAENGNVQEQEMYMVMAVYGTMGLVLLAGGVLQLWAGWRATRFRGYALTIVGIVTAMMGSLTCYCAPTGIALGIWGMILILNPDIKYAYQMGKSQSREKILQHFSFRGDSWSPPPQPQPPQSQPPHNPFNI